MAQSYNGVSYSGSVYGSSAAPPAAPASAPQQYDAFGYNTNLYGSSVAPPAAPAYKLGQYNSFQYNTLWYNGWIVNLQLVLTESIVMSVEAPKADTLTLQDDGPTFDITKGPQDTLDLHDWIRVERKPVNIPWEN